MEGIYDFIHLIASHYSPLAHPLTSNNPYPLLTTLYSLLQPRFASLTEFRASLYSFSYALLGICLCKDPEAQRRKVCQRLPCLRGGERKYRRRKLQ